MCALISLLMQTLSMLDHSHASRVALKINPEYDVYPLTLIPYPKILYKI